MKKWFNLLLVFILITNLTVISNAQVDLENIENEIKSIEDSKDKIDNLRTQDSGEYLKKEWLDFIGDRKIGKYLISVSDFIERFNPLIKTIIGYPYSLSWAFIFGVLIWLTLFYLIVGPSSAMFNSNKIGILVSIVIVSIIGTTGVIKKAVDMLSFILNNVWIAIVSLIIAVIISMIGAKIGKMLKKKIEKAKAKSKEEETDKHRKIIKADAKVAEIDLDSYREGAD